MNREGGKTMEANTLIRKIHMSCPLCGKTHEIEERKRTIEVLVPAMYVGCSDFLHFSVPDKGPF